MEKQKEEMKKEARATSAVLCTLSDAQSPESKTHEALLGFGPPFPSVQLPVLLTSLPLQRAVSRYHLRRPCNAKSLILPPPLPLRARYILTVLR